MTCVYEYVVCESLYPISFRPGDDDRSLTSQCVPFGGMKVYLSCNNIGKQDTKTTRKGLSLSVYHVSPNMDLCVLLSHKEVVKKNSVNIVKGRSKGLASVCFSYDYLANKNPISVKTMVKKIISLVSNSRAIGPCSDCSLPVWKVKIYNEFAGGYVRVMGKKVLANESDKGTIYKIAKGKSFYLYDPDAKKYICWKNKTVPTLVPRKYQHPRMMKYCEFQEYVSEYDSTSHVELVATFDNRAKMMFNRNGRMFKRRCDFSARHHSHHLCKQRYKAAAFLISCSCPKPEKVCSHGLENVRELKDFCSSVKKSSKIRSNDILRNS